MIARGGDRSLLFTAQLLPGGIPRSTFDGGENSLRLVACFNEQALGEVIFGVVEGVKNHALDLLIGEAVGRFYFNLRLLAAALFARGYLQDSVCVDEKLDFD